MPRVSFERPAGHAALVRISRQDRRQGMRAPIENHDPVFRGRQASRRAMR